MPPKIRFPRSFWPCSALSFAAGGFACLGMAPWNAWPVLLVSLSALYVLIAQSRAPRAAFFYGWLFSFSYFLFGLLWVGNALLVKGNPYAWAWPLAVCGLPLLLSFFPALGLYAARKFGNLSDGRGFLAFTAFFAGSEWLRGYLFTGFPWNLFGYTWAGLPEMIQNVAVGNIYFLTWLTVFWFSLPGFLFLKSGTKKENTGLVLFAVFSFVLCFGFGYWRLAGAPSGPSEKSVHIKLVQPSIPQDEKWERELMIRHFSRQVALSRAEGEQPGGTTFIIWPETSLSYWLAQDPSAIGMIRDALRSYSGTAYLLTGMLRHDPEQKKYFNSLVMIDRDGTISNVYDKHHLVPFGEYIPYQPWIPLRPVVQFTGFASGRGPQTFTTPEGISYSPVICYEIIFSGMLTDRPGAPDFIVNVTNDAWYGISPGPHQHFTQAVFRAVEEGIPVVRAANTGFSGLIDPYGRIMEKSELFQEYEKILALPAKNMVLKNYIAYKNILFAMMLLTLIIIGRLKIRP